MASEKKNAPEPNNTMLFNQPVQPCELYILLEWIVNPSWICFFSPFGVVVVTNMSQVWILSLSGCFIIMGEDVLFLLCCVLALVVWAQSGFLSRIDNIVFAAALCIYFPLSTPWYLFPFFHKIVSEWCRKHFCLCGLYT